MNEIVNFVKEILMLETNERIPVGLCAFENCNQSSQKRVVRNKRKKEMRLSELME